MEGRTAIILHGAGLGPWSEERAKSYAERYSSVEVPVLDGHPGSTYPFTTIKDAADHVISIIDTEWGGHVTLLSGLSLGAQIALEILSMRPDIAEHAIIESANVTGTHMPKSIIRGSVRISWPLVKRKWFSRLRFRSLRMDDGLFEKYYEESSKTKTRDAEDFLSESLSYRMPPGLEKTEAKVTVIYGEKETRAIKKSASLIHDAVPGSSLVMIPRLHHGQASMSLHVAYASIVSDALR